MHDDLAEKFFDEKIAPAQRDKGVTEERLQAVRERFIEDVVLAREELAQYRPSDGAGEFRYVTVAGGQQVGVPRVGGYLYGAGGLQEEDTEPDRGEYVDDAGEVMRYVAVDGDQVGVLTVARSGWYRYDSATASLTQVTDDEADAATAGRYFDDQILPGLLGDGMPADGIAHLRRRYIKDTVADRAAMAQLRELYG